MGRCLPICINACNEKLQYYNQSLRVISVTINEVIISNGLILTNVPINEILRLKRRLFNKKHNLWVQYFDDVYNFDKNIRLNTIQNVKSILNKIGGINCQKKHGEKIKKNLNTGVPWIKGKKGFIPWNKNKTKNDTPQLALISKQRKGSGNPMYGTTMSEEEKLKASIRVKTNILLGKFTPNSNNRNTHWDSYYDGKKYRSSWEALYQCIDPDAEYETLRITYDYLGKNYIYIVDFINHDKKQVIEVKPKELLSDDKTQAKLSSLSNWCNENHYTMLMVDKNWLINNKIDFLNKPFDDYTKKKIGKLYEIKK